jgi:hypothetical protein
MPLDPLAIGMAIVLLVAFVFIGSRFFPEHVNLTPWRSADPPPVVREDDDARFSWGSDAPKDDEP